MAASQPPPQPTHRSAEGAQTEATAAVAAAVQRYRRDADVGVLFDALRAIARGADDQVLQDAATPYRDLPEVVIPIYETIVEREGAAAQAMVILANAYWLTGRGAEPVDRLATRAKAKDPNNRGAWHLWALAEPDLRGRMDRWRKTSEQFPGDQLARAALADNATSLANDEHDPVALKIAIEAYTSLLTEATDAAQRSALESTLRTLRGWRF